MFLGIFLFLFFDGYVFRFILSINLMILLWRDYPNFVVELLCKLLADLLTFVYCLLLAVHELAHVSLILPDIFSCFFI